MNRIGPKMRDGICAFLICTFISIILIGCVKECEVPEPKQPPKKLIINTKESSNKGTIIVKDGEDIVFSYTGIIHIVNNGKSGEDIDIQIQIKDNAVEGEE